MYIKGERVQLDGVRYEAQWWSQGDRPKSGDTEPGTTPWLRVEDEPADA